MIWLCQITFAGVGALTASQLATNHGWPVLAAIVVGGLVALPMGLIIGFLTIRLGDLYVALVTLTFGLLMENLVFTIGIFTNGGLGVNMNRPSWAVTDKAFAYVCLVAFSIIGLFVMNLRRSTTGLALNAVRWSPPGARTLGISVVQMKILVAGLGALVAGIGGGFLVTAQTSAQPGEFATFLGVVWLAALVTIGIRSNAAALVAGLSFTMLPALALAYLPAWTGQLPAILFGLGAIGVAKFPDGSLEQGGEMFRKWVFERADRRSSSSGAPGSTGGLADAAADAGTRPWLRVTSSKRFPREHRYSHRSPALGRCGLGDADPTVPVLSATGITVRFGGLTALSDVSLEVPPGTIVGLVGPNGAGKSTLFAVLSGLLRPATGRVFLRGNDVTGASPQLRARQGLARTFQQPELFMGLTVREHLVLAHRVRYSRQRLWRDMVDPRSLLPAGQEENERVDELLELLDLTHVARAAVGALPLGMSRLVEIARALATRPDVVLLDEPLSGLDMRESENLASVFRRVVDNDQRKVSLLMVEHDVATVLSLSSKIFVLDFGELIASGTPSEIRGNAAVRSAYLGDDDSTTSAEAEEAQ